MLRWVFWLGVDWDGACQTDNQAEAKEASHRKGSKYRIRIRDQHDDDPFLAVYPDDQAIATDFGQ